MPFDPDSFIARVKQEDKNQEQNPDFDPDSFIARVKQEDKDQEQNPAFDPDSSKSQSVGEQPAPEQTEQRPEGGFDPDAFVEKTREMSKSFDPDAYLAKANQPSKQPTAGPQDVEKMDQDEANDQAAKILRERRKEAAEAVKRGEPGADYDYVQANKAYRELRTLPERVKDAWDEADIAGGTWSWLKSTAKSLGALHPAVHAYEEGKKIELEEAQRKRDFLATAREKAVKAGDQQTVDAIDFGKVDVPEEAYKIPRGEAIKRRLGAGFKNAPAAAAGAAVGVTDLGRAAAGAIESGAAEAADLLGAKKVASGMDLAKLRTLSAVDKATEEALKATGQDRDVFEGARIVGGVATPVSLPGAGAAYKAATEAVAPIARGIQKVADVTTPALRKGLEAGISTAGKVGEVGTSLGTDAAVLKGVLALRHVPVPYFGTGVASAATTGISTSRNFLFNLGSRLRQPFEALTQSKSLFGREAGILPTEIGTKYAAFKDKLLAPFQGAGDIAGAAVKQRQGGFVDDLVNGGRKAAEDLERKLSDLVDKRQLELDKGIKRSTITQSKIENVQARLQAIDRGNKLMERLNQLPVQDAVDLLHGHIGDAITHAAIGAGIGTTLAAGQGDENAFEAGVGPGMFYGTAALLLGKAIKTSTDPVTGETRMKVDPQEVRNQTADLVENAANDLDVTHTPEARAKVLNDIEQQGHSTQIDRDTGTVTRYTESDDGIQASTEPLLESGQSEPLRHSTAGVRIKPGSMSNTKQILMQRERARLDREAARAKAKAERKGPSEPETVEVPEAPAGESSTEIAAPEEQVTRVPEELRTKALQGARVEVEPTVQRRPGKLTPKENRPTDELVIPAEEQPAQTVEKAAEVAPEVTPEPEQASTAPEIKRVAGRVRIRPKTVKIEDLFDHPTGTAVDSTRRMVGEFFTPQRSAAVARRKLLSHFRNANNDAAVADLQALYKEKPNANVDDIVDALVGKRLRDLAAAAESESSARDVETLKGLEASELTSAKKSKKVLAMENPTKDAGPSMAKKNVLSEKKQPEIQIDVSETAHTKDTTTPKVPKKPRKVPAMEKPITEPTKDAGPKLLKQEPAASKIAPVTVDSILKRKTRMTDTSIGDAVKHIEDLDLDSLSPADSAAVTKALESVQKEYDELASEIEVSGVAFRTGQTGPMSTLKDAAHNMADYGNYANKAVELNAVLKKVKAGKATPKEIEQLKEEGIDIADIDGELDKNWKHYKRLSEAYYATNRFLSREGKHITFLSDELRGIQ